MIINIHGIKLYHWLLILRETRPPAIVEWPGSWQLPLIARTPVKSCHCISMLQVPAGTSLLTCNTPKMQPGQLHEKDWLCRQISNHNSKWPQALENPRRNWFPVIGPTASLSWPTFQHLKSPVCPSYQSSLLAKARPERFSWIEQTANPFFLRQML